VANRTVEPEMSVSGVSSPLNGTGMNRGGCWSLTEANNQKALRPEDKAI